MYNGIEMPKRPVKKTGRGNLKQLLTNRYIRLVLIPLAFYAIFLIFYTWPWATHFNGYFFSDSGDGLQNVWNMWWVNFSVTHLHQLPWTTKYLDWPYGTSLLGQTMNPFNGFVAIVLQKLLTLSQAFNIMVIFSFLFGGLTTFWLCHYFTKRYAPSLIGGFVFTFSSYHFAHAIGHMQLVSLEWIPLFILLWWKLMTKPRYRLAVGATIVLFLVLFCDYYYFLYCVSTAVAISIYLWHKKELAPLKRKQTYRPFLVFLILALIMVAPLPIALLRENAHDPLQGAHNARLFSTDLFTTIIDGGFWKFASLTTWYWRHVKAYIAESSVYFGISVITLMVITIWKRNKIHRDTVFWIVIGSVFAIFSLGPRLLVLGYSINHAPLPYALLEKLFPTLQLSGDPDRLIVMTFLAAAILSSFVLSKLKLRTRKGQLLLALFCLVLFIEYWPNHLPLTPVAQPKYVYVLKSLPYSGVLDNAALSASYQLYHQTTFDKPMVLGYISRTPLSVQNKDNQLVASLSLTNYASLCSVYHVRYLTEPAFRKMTFNFPVIYRGTTDVIYDVKDSPNC
jgi:hypothetical protein